MQEILTVFAPRVVHPPLVFPQGVLKLFLLFSSDHVGTD